MQTIAGPDMWTASTTARRAQAAVEFLQWLTAPEQMLKDAMATGHLPFRLASLIDDRLHRVRKEVPGRRRLRGEPENVEQARPVLAAYPQISEAMGLAIVSAMLGEKEPKQALDEAAAQANDALALPATRRRRRGGCASGVDGVGSRGGVGVHPARGDPDRVFGIIPIVWGLSCPSRARG